MGVHPDPATAVDRESGSAPPPQHTTGHLLNGELGREFAVIQLTESDQLFAQHGGLELALSIMVSVLPVATTALARTSNWTRRRHPPGRRLVNLDGIGSAVPGMAVLGHEHGDLLAWEGVPDEDHAPLVPGHAVPAVSHRPDLDIEAPAQPALCARRPALRPAPRIL